MRTFVSIVSIILGLTLILVSTATLVSSKAKWEFFQLFGQPRVDARMEKLIEENAIPSGSEGAFEELIMEIYFWDSMILILGTAILTGIIGMVLLIFGYLIHSSRSIHAMRRKVSEHRVA